ncbi:MAG: cell surface protein, partial [Prevotella sp.]|nr:cell surface protein [Prevotella sp.]
MRRIFLLSVYSSLVLFFSQRAWGQVSFLDARVSEYGQLEQVLGDKWNTVDSLVVYGPINEADFTTMWKCSFEGKLTVLNLEHAQVENYKIPECAFFKRDRQVIDDPRAYQGVVYLPLRRLILPEGIREIGDYAFSRMKLEQVNIP